MHEGVAKAFLRKEGLSLDNVVFVKGFFEDTLPELAKEGPKIAVLHFDGDLWTSAVHTFKNLLPHVVKGGYVVIHDYPQFAGVEQAVRDFFDVSKLVIRGNEEVYILKE
jgi:hypothetical protein